MIVTIDGPAGAGKTTMARRLADSLKIAYLDTGAMFRFVALILGEKALHLSEAELDNSLRQIGFSLTGRGGKAALLAGGRELPEEGRSEMTGNLASRFATLGVVREYLKGEQQRLGRSVSLLAEGRDMGTVVFPDAEYKFFLDAGVSERAKRRCAQLKAMGMKADFESIARDIAMRDERDRNRAIAPLKPAPDAFVIDSGNMAPDEVLRVMLKRIGPMSAKE